jgi:hypothetical protein
VLVRVENLMGKSTDTRFELHGIEGAVAQMREHCSW